MDAPFRIHVVMILGSLMSIGIITTQALHPYEDHEIEAHLHRLNKPPIKSITLEDGDIIDCIDIYKQPALDHPLLKGHKIMMSPSSWPINQSAIVHPQQKPMLQSAWQKSEGCPNLTVPIRRVQKSDLLRASSLEGFGKLEIELPFFVYVKSAGARLENTYIGAKAEVNAWTVPVVEDNEWSRASVEINDGAINKNSIEAGWIVNPQLYGDKQTRLYAYWTADHYSQTGCYNILCSGFVHMDNTYVLGSAISLLSVAGGQQVTVDIQMFQDRNATAWWLTVNGVIQGYWPMEIFYNQFFKESGIVKFSGGVLDKSDDEDTATQMGSGQPAENGQGQAAFMRNPQVMDSDYNFGAPYYDDLITFYNVSCYSVNVPDETMIFFGGPGGCKY